MMRKMLDGGDNPWEYTERSSVVDWAQDHVLLAVCLAATSWFAVVYAMTTIYDIFA
jgi:hypothetical protein